MVHNHYRASIGRYRGNDNGYSAQYFHGAIDGLRIYNRSLSNNEVNDLFNSCSTNSYDESNFFSTLQVFPNPSNGIIKIKLSSPFKGQAFISISNILGRKILFEKIVTKETNSEKEIDISFLSSGTYLIQVLSEKNIITKRIIIKK